MKGLLAGVNDLWAGFGLVVKVPSIRRWAIWPIIVNVLLVIGLELSAIYGLYRLVHAYWNPGSTTGLIAFWMSMGALAIIALILAGGLVLLISTVVAAPFYTKLAEAALEHLTGRDLPDTGPIWKIALVTMWQQFVKLLIFMGIQVILLAFHFIPVAGSVLGFVVSSLYIAFDFVDYPLEPLGKSVSERWKFVLSHKADSIGFGAAALMITLIPGLNLLTAPAAVAGAAKMVLRLEGKNVR